MVEQMKDTAMKSNSVNIDANELLELAAIFRALAPDERDFLKRAMLGMIRDKKQVKPTKRTARIYQFTQAA